MVMLKLIFLLWWCGGQIASTMQADEEVESVGPASAQCMLAKKTKRVLVAGRSEVHTMYKYRLRHKAKRATEYFKQWHKNSLLVILEDGVQEDEGFLPVKLQKCTENMMAVQNWNLIDEERSEGVDHLVFKINPGSRLQYIAKKGNHVVAADPPLKCDAELLQRPKEEFEMTGEPESLAKSDPLVNDCKALFIRTVKDICQKKMDLEVESASVKIVDGLEIKMSVDVTGPAGKTTRHSPACFFEGNPGAKDASLLQAGVDPAETDPLPEEREGMTATLETWSDLCKADEEDGNLDISLEEEVGKGELSLHKGYEHINDALPLVEVEVRSDLPQSYDMREKYPKCFQQQGREAVRSQAKCGSCWAFAGATALMNNLCTSTNENSAAFNSATDRSEISVQQIMSCNKDKRGCEGGSMYQVDEAAKRLGLSKEKDIPYACNSGHYNHHYANGDGKCSRAPWGRQCDATNRVEAWKYGGAYRITGESQIMTLLSQGHSLYFTMKLTKEFEENLFTGVFKPVSPWTPGGHAMAMIGYGVQDGDNYWLIQNSWSTRWQKSGFAKILRGANVGGIEDGVFYPRAWLDGASPKNFNCQDVSEVNELSVTGVTCRQLQYYCSRQGGVGDIARLQCPATCKTCPKEEEPTNPSEPRPAPPPAPLPPPPAPPPQSPAPLPATPPPSSEDLPQYLYIGPSATREKCSALTDGTLNCELDTEEPTPDGAHVYKMGTGAWNGEKETIKWEVCISKEGGWTEEAFVKCS